MGLELFSKLWPWNVPEYQLWGWEIPTAWFFAGIGAGAFLAAALAELLGKEEYRDISRLGGYMSAPALAIAGFLLAIDLSDIGTMLRAMLLGPLTFTNMGSWMAIGAVLIFINIILGALYSYGWWKNKGRKFRLPIAVIGIPVSILVGIYPGMLLKAIPVIPLWNTTYMPLLIALSAFSTGIAAACGAALIPGLVKETPKKAVHRFSLADDGIIVLEIIVLYLFIKAVGEGVALEEVNPLGKVAAAESLNALTTGIYSWAFWGGLIIIGLVTPLIISGVSILTKNISKNIYLAKFSFVLVGGLFLRFLVIYAAVKQELGFALEIVTFPVL